MAIVDCFGKETVNGPNYNVTDQFSYQKSPHWKLGTAPRNTLDTKGKYEHYFRKDIDVFVYYYLFGSLIPIKLTRLGGLIMGILGSVGI